MVQTLLNPAQFLYQVTTLINNDDDNEKEEEEEKNHIEKIGTQLSRIF